MVKKRVVKRKPTTVKNAKVPPGRHFVGKYNKANVEKEMKKAGVHPNSAEGRHIHALLKGKAWRTGNGHG